MKTSKDHQRGPHGGQILKCKRCGQLWRKDGAYQKIPRRLLRSSCCGALMWRPNVDTKILDRTGTSNRLVLSLTGDGVTEVVTRYCKHLITNRR